MRLPLLGLLFMTIGSLEAAAESRPPAITWEWFNAATIHLKNQEAGNRSQTLAAHYYRLAAERGNAAAAYKLGEMWEEGRGLQQDYGQALRWYRLAAEQGDRYALFKLGLFSQKGWGGGKDAKKAARFYLAAAQAGNLWGLHMLAFMLADGDGLDPDGGRAILYFEQSLPFTGDHWAKWKLAVLLGDRDPGRADRLMQEAAAAGNPEALKAKAAQPRK